MNNSKTKGTQTWLIVGSAMAAYALADMNAWLSPQIVTSFMEEKSVGEAQAGEYAGLELSALFIASFFSSLLARRFPIKLGGVLGALTSLICYFLIPIAESELAISVIRFVSGLGLGALVTSSILAISTVKDPETHYPKIYIASSLSGSFFLFVILPFQSLFPEGTSMFTAIAVMMLMIMPFAVWNLPNRANAESVDVAVSALRIGLPNTSSYLLAASVFVYSIACGITFTFSHLLGEKASLSADQINNILSFTILVSIPGNLACMFLAKKFGSFLPAVVALLINTVSNYWILTTESQLGFIVSIALTLATLYFLFPTWQGAAMRFDKSGGCAAAIGSAFSFSIACASVFGGWLIENVSLTTIAFVICFINILALVIFTIAFRFESVNKSPAADAVASI